ncbi:hypothetical protein FKM82_023197 [Ascaphus truei]
MAVLDIGLGYRGLKSTSVGDTGQPLCNSTRVPANHACTSGRIKVLLIAPVHKYHTKNLHTQSFTSLGCREHEIGNRVILFSNMYHT